RAREIPLDDETMATIAELREKAGERRPLAGHTPELTAKLAEHFSREHVFVTKANTTWRHNLLVRFYAICKRAGIEGAQRGGSVDLHSLRVTFTTLAIDHGASPKAVQAILGHSTLGMTMGVYAKATERAKRDAIGALPFAKVSAPEGVIPVRNAHRMSTSNSEAAEVQAAEAIA
ncbi:MAG: site-specific integrase, partial [Planctomycetes bacterium]|nr:site-specific integrase [Planctomycetota bacterium]